MNKFTFTLLVLFSFLAKNSAVDQSPVAPLSNATGLVQISGNAIEDCSNGIDDDDDGLVDFFDPDCPCSDYKDCGDPFFSNCAANCESDSTNTAFSMTAGATNTAVYLFGTILTVGDVDGDCLPDILSVSGLASDPGIQVIDGITKDVKYIASSDGSNGYMCTGDVDKDGMAEIFFVFSPTGSSDYFVVRYDFNQGTNTLDLTWRSNLPIDYLTSDFVKLDAVPLLADFNQDDRAEVYIGNQIFDSQTGVELVKMGDNFNRGGAGRPSNNASELVTRGIKNSAIAVDLLDDQSCPTCEGLELAAGNQVFTVDIQSYTDPSLNTMSLAVERPDMLDGLTAIADFDMDGDLDIIVGDYNGDNTTNARIYIWDGQTSDYIGQPFVYQTTSPSLLGIPVVGDVDGDGRPEIVFNDGMINVFEDYIEGGGATWGSVPSATRVASVDTDDHGLGIILFDFESDGKAEIINRNTEGLKVYDSELNVKGALPILALTIHESPIIADVDNDGEAELLTYGNAPGTPSFSTHFLHVVESNSFAWPNTRKVWNQFSYFNVNINDDGTLPIEQQDHSLAGDGALNNFNEQYAIPVPTDAEATVELLELTCTAAGTQIVFEVCNEGSIGSLPVSLPISIYEGDPTLLNAPLLSTFQLGVVLGPSDCLQFSEMINGLGEIFVVVNDDGSLPRPYEVATALPTSNFFECNYRDNIDGDPSISTNLAQLDLGADFSICENGMFELDAGDSFASYLWFDGSTAQTKTVFGAGTFWVAATDTCGFTQNDSITISLDPIDQVDLGEDIISCGPQTITLDAGDFDTYNWAPDFGAACMDCPTISFQISQDTQVIVIVGSDLGCFSTDTIDLFFVIPPSTFDSLNACVGDTLFIGGEPYFSDTTVVQNFSTALNCDSIHTTKAIFTEPIFTEEVIQLCEGDTTIVFGNPIFQNETISETFSSSIGCDSIHEVTVAFFDFILTFDTLRLCEGDTAIVFGNAVFENSTLSETYPSSSACDSTHTITAIFIDLLFSDETIQLCAGDTAFVFGNQILQDEILSQTFTSSTGCDSTHTVTLQFTDLIFTTETIRLCEGDTVSVFGNPVFQNTILSETYPSAADCDSTHTVTAIFSPALFTAEVFSLCEGDSIVVFGNTIFQDDLVAQTFISSLGCDSTHEVQVAFSNFIFTFDTLRLCKGDTAVVFGNTIVENDTRAESYLSASFCDSTHQITSIFSENKQTFENLQSCPGDTLIVFGNAVFEDQIISKSFTAANGCDSTHEVRVNFFLPLSSSEEINLCVGDTLLLFGNIVTENETLLQNLVAVNGCDSTHEVSVVFFPSFSSSEEINLCAGDTLFLLGNMVTQDDVLLQNLVAANGCDSVHQIIVNVWEEIEIYTTQTICAGESITFFNQNISEPGIYMETLPSNVGSCDTLYLLDVEIQPEINFSLPDTITSLSGQAIRLPLVMTAPDVQILWSPSIGLSCSDCPRPLAILSENQNYTVTLNDPAGCSAIGNISVLVNEAEEVYIPNAFSPNFDGFNDFFTVYSNEKIIEIERMQIYDRWGGLLYEQEKTLPNVTAAGWDGTRNGKSVSEGVYVYQVWLRSVDGTVEVLSGEVVVVR